LGLRLHPVFQGRPFSFAALLIKILGVQANLPLNQFGHQCLLLLSTGLVIQNYSSCPMNWVLSCTSNDKGGWLKKSYTQKGYDYQSISIARASVQSVAIDGDYEIRAVCSCMLTRTAFAGDEVLDQCVSDPGHAIYRAFQTKNVWTFLRLDTRTGLVWQIQYGDHPATLPVNSLPLVNKQGSRAGRFMLCPTRNLFNFLLLDQDDGRMWSAQWSLEDKSRFIAPLFFVDPAEIAPPSK
jgi:hypothetical protein